MKNDKYIIIKILTVVGLYFLLATISGATGYDSDYCLDCDTGGSVPEYNIENEHNLIHLPPGSSALNYEDLEKIDREQAERENLDYETVRREEIEAEEAAKRAQEERRRQYEKEAEEAERKRQEYLNNRQQYQSDYVDRVPSEVARYQQQGSTINQTENFVDSYNTRTAQSIRDYDPNAIGSMYSDNVTENYYITEFGKAGNYNQLLNMAVGGGEELIGTVSDTILLDVYEGTNKKIDRNNLGSYAAKIIQPERLNKEIMEVKTPPWYLYGVCIFLMIILLTISRVSGMHINKDVLREKRLTEILALSAINKKNQQMFDADSMNLDI